MKFRFISKQDVHNMKVGDVYGIFTPNFLE